MGSTIWPDNATGEVVREVYEERARQERKFPGQVIPDGTGGPVRDVREAEARTRCDQRTEDGKVTWCDVLEEEVAEALAAPANSAALRKELIQVAAVACRWVEQIDARRRR